MTINVNVQYNGGSLPDMILLTLPGMFLPYGNPEVLSFAVYVPTQMFGHFPSQSGGCSGGLDMFRLFFKLCRQGTYVPGRS